MCSNEKTIAIHQPNYIPWLGYFHKILNSDIFVALDHVEFTRRGFTNRNRVKGPNGVVWLTVPVKVELHVPIKDVKIDNSRDWRRKHINTLKAFYGKAPYFDDIFSLIEEVYERDWNMLEDLNLALINKIMEILNIRRKIILSRNLNIQGKKMNMIIEICKKVGGKVYLSGKGAMKYQDPEIFEKNGIKLVYQEFEHPIYPQRFGEFVPNLSILDILFNVGPDKARDILNSL